MAGNRVALITGGNKGIGLETARQLGKQKITVLIGARDQARGRDAADKLKAEGIDARAVTLDVTDAASIAAAAAQVTKDFGRLDILINNAAVMQHGRDGAPSTTTVAVHRETFEANFFGLIAVTQAFLPLLRKSEGGRIVNLTSILGSLAEHSDPNSPIHHARIVAYDCSKAAVNMFTIELAQELKDTKIKVNAAHPGWVKTDMGGAEAPMEIVDGAKTSVWLATLDEKGPSGGYFHKDVHMRW